MTRRERTRLVWDDRAACWICVHIPAAPTRADCLLRAWARFQDWRTR